VHLSVRVGESANDYQEIAAKDKLSDLQLRVRQLLDQVDQISKEQTYQRVSLFLTITVEPLILAFRSTELFWRPYTG